MPGKQIRHRFGLFAALVLLVPFAWAEDLLRESYIYSGNLSPRDGCQLAEQALKRQAVARQCGSRMSGGALRFKSETADDLYCLHFETVGGRVTAYDGRAINPAEPVTEAGLMVLRCTVEASVTVQCDQGRRDPAFLPAPEGLVRLNEIVFREGEAMKIGITLPADLPGEIHVASVQLPYWEDDKRAWRLYTNPYQPGAALQPGARLDLPNAAYSRRWRCPRDGAASRSP